MPTWDELVAEFEKKPTDIAKVEWLNAAPIEALARVGAKRGGRQVVMYASAFLQKPTVASMNLQLTHEELNAFMSILSELDCSKGLTLILHTPGGLTTAAETIVSYLRSKFMDMEVVVPTFAMSAGTMIALAANRLLMGRQSQLGPIDPQIPLQGRTISAGAIVEQFDVARTEVLNNQRAAHLWAPILQSMGPSLLQEAKNALQYGEQMVAKWLTQYMFAGSPNAFERGRAAAHHFNDSGKHKSHGRRIDRNEARQQGIVVEDLELDQELQDAVLSAYHLATIYFEKTAAAKLVFSSAGRRWVKNV